MARKQPNLHLRGGVYSLRVRVPDALRPLVGKTEIWKSLHTGDLKEAQEAARVERVKLDHEWNKLRRSLAPKKVTELSDAEIFNLAINWFVEKERANNDQPPWDDRRQAEIELGEVANWDTLAPALFKEAERILRANGLAIDPESPDFLRLQKELRAAWIETERRQFAGQFLQSPFDPNPKFNSVSEHSSVQRVEKASLANVMEAVTNDETKPNLTGKTALKRDAQWRTIKEFFGAETELKTITRQQMRDFMKLLEKLPSNASKHLPGRTIFEAAELGGKLPKMSVDTKNAYMRALGSLFRFALNEGMIDAGPSVGLLFVNKTKVRNRDKRLPFDIDDLRVIFGAPLYRGCNDDAAGYSKPGPNIIRRGRFWLAPIGLFTGMRLNEIAQLSLDDFAREGDVDIILVRGDDGDEKRVKTEAGHRFIPVHPELKKMGLLAYIEERRRIDAPNAPAFNLPVGTTGYRSDPASKWFARFLRHAGITDRRKVFHSLRHCFRDALCEADLSREKVLALGGWSGGRTDDNYGKGLSAATLAKDIEAVRYDGLDLSHLYLTNRV